MEGIIFNVLTNIGLSIGYSFVNYLSKAKNGEAFSGRKLTRTGAVATVIGVAAAVSGFELTADNWQAFAASNAGLIAYTDKALIVALKSEMLKRLLPLLLIVFSLSSCASIQDGKVNIEGVKADLETAKSVIVEVEQVVLDLEAAGLAKSDRVAEINGRLAKVKALILTAKELIKAGQDRDAFRILLQVNKLMIQLSDKAE